MVVGPSALLLEKHCVRLFANDDDDEFNARGCVKLKGAPFHDESQLQLGHTHMVHWRQLVQAPRGIPRT